MHADNRKTDTLIIGESPTYGLDDTTITAEAKYSINFTRSGRKVCLRLHYNGSNSFFFVNATKMYLFLNQSERFRNKTISYNI